MVNKKQSSLLKFRRTPSTPTTSSDGVEPKFLTTDTSFGHVVTMIALRFCRRITVDIKTENRIVVYFGLIVFGGIVGDFAPILCRAFMPIRTTKDSYINQYFVKIGWFWTLFLTLPFITMTSHVMSSFVSKEKAMTDAGDSSSTEGSRTSRIKEVVGSLVTRDTARMVVNTIVWYISVNSFVSIEKTVGSCSVTSASQSRDFCLKKGGSWTGFDISGHTFLLMFSTLLILEEVSIMVGWEPFGHHLNAQNQQFLKSLKIGPNKQFIVFEKMSTMIRVNFMFLTIFVFLSDFMLMQTALFYHTMIQKAAAGLWATFCWFLLYKIIFKIDIFHQVIKPPSRPYIEQ